MNAETQAQVEQLREWIGETPKKGLVFFGGAGVSTESGIPDFRSTDGLYNQQYDYPPEVIISRTFFDANPAEFYRFYCDRMLFLEAAPNTCHAKLAQLEEDGILRAVITQNIDGLHQRAGSHNVLELHGSVLRNYCMKCGEFYDVEQLMAAHEADGEGVPHCHCGGIIKPDVVLYEESLDSNVLQASVQAIAEASLMIVAGTSLVVYPAAGLLQYFQGDHLVIVNRTPTPGDRYADLCIAANVGEVFDF